MRLDAAGLDAHHRATARLDRAAAELVRAPEASAVTEVLASRRDAQVAAELVRAQDEVDGYLLDVLA